MVLRRIMFSVIVSVVLLAGASMSFTQYRPPWRVGDKVETYNTSTRHWERATIIRIDESRSDGRGFWYTVRLDNPQAGNPQWTTTPDRIRAAESRSADTPTNSRPGANSSRAATALRVGERVDVFYNQKQGKNRGTIIEVGEGKYKLHYNGCTPGSDEWVDRLSVRPPATISANAPEIKFLIGKWSMFAADSPATGGDNVTGAKAPPLQIKADGTYIWYFSPGKPPVKGRWTTDAKVEGAETGTQAEVGIIINDPTGQDWKVYRWIVSFDNEDRVTAHRMCSDVTGVGTRIR